MVGLVLPWVKWEVQKRQDALAYKRATIAEWRRAIAEATETMRGGLGNFGQSSAYASLRPHLKPEVVEQIEHPRIFIEPGSRGDSPVAHVLQDEVARVEREWGLI